MHELRVTQVGDDLAIVLSEEVAKLLDVRPGATVFASPTAAGIGLIRADSKAQAQLEAGRRIMARYKDALRKLAE
jgi:putative addiction module antidote